MHALFIRNDFCTIFAEIISRKMIKDFINVNFSRYLFSSLQVKFEW